MRQASGTLPEIAHAPPLIRDAPGILIIKAGDPPFTLPEANAGYTVYYPGAGFSACRTLGHGAWL
jgi:hypothetical protein